MAHDEVKLVELASYISRGITPSYTVSEGVCVINQKCIRNGKLSLNETRLHNEAKKKVPADKIVQTMDILVNSTGTGTLGRVAQVTDNIRATVDSHVTIVRPAKEVNPLFLGYAVKWRQPYIEALAEGSTGQTELSRFRLGDEITIPLPSLAAQKQIAETLYAIDCKINTNSMINDNLQQQAAALFANFYDHAETEVSFTEIIQILGGGTPKTGESSYWNGNVPFFTPKDVGSPYTLSTEKTITEEGLAHCNSRLYPVNTVFVTARGTVGKVGLPGVPMAMNQSCYALVGKETHQLLVYFYTLKAVDRLKHKASGAVFDAITTRDFESETIMKLSDEDAKGFLDVAEPIYQAVLSNSIENLRLATLRNSLLPKLMSGEIDVSDIQL